MHQIYNTLHLNINKSIRSSHWTEHIVYKCIIQSFLSDNSPSHSHNSTYLFQAYCNYDGLWSIHTAHAYNHNWIIWIEQPQTVSIFIQQIWYCLQSFTVHSFIKYTAKNLLPTFNLGYEYSICIAPWYMHNWMVC